MKRLFLSLFVMLGSFMFYGTTDANASEISNFNNYEELKNYVLNHDDVKIEDLNNGTENGIAVTAINYEEKLNTQENGNRNGTTTISTLVLGNLTEEEYATYASGSNTIRDVVDYGGTSVRLDWSSEIRNGIEYYGIDTIAQYPISAPQATISGMATIGFEQSGNNPETGFNAFGDSFNYHANGGQWYEFTVGLNSNFASLVANNGFGTLVAYGSVTFASGGNTQPANATTPLFIAG